MTTETEYEKMTRMLSVLNDVASQGSHSTTGGDTTITISQHEMVADRDHYEGLVNALTYAEKLLKNNNK